VSQNYIYDGTTPASGQYLLRPHYWADPEAPQTGTHSTSFRVGVALLEQDPDIHFVGHGPEACFQADISIHPESEDPCAPIVSSPGNLAIAGLTPGVTRGFWSVTRIGDRAAATLHLLFNDSDQETLEQVAGTARTFPQLLDGLDATPALAGSRPVQMLKSLFRPVIKVPKVPVQAKAPARSEEPNAGAAETRV
jgi:hypothetical protein